MALPPSGVNVIEEMVRSVVPQFQDTPTNSKRFVPVPVVWAKLRLLTSSPVALDTAPSNVTSPVGGASTKVAVQVLSASIVTEPSAQSGSPVQLPNT